MRTLVFVIACVVGVVIHNFYPSFAVGMILGILASKMCAHDYKMIHENVSVIDTKGVENCYVHGCCKCGKVTFERYHQLGE